MKWLFAPPLAFLALIGSVVFVAVLGGHGVPTLPASAEAAAEIPPVALAAYQTAAPLCPGLSWGILAGIGKEETGHGTANGHHLDDTGQAVPANPPLHSNVNNGALGYAYGPMQFLKSTWMAYGPRVDPGDNTDMASGPIQNINPAAKAAALLLCNAAGGQITDEPSLRKAINAYSGNTDGYVDDVLTLAQLYAPGPSSTSAAASPPPATSGVGLRILYAAIQFVGIPYGNGNPKYGDPGIEFSGHPGSVWVKGHWVAHDPRYSTIDCSGLVNATLYLAFKLDLNFCSDGYAQDSRFQHVAMDQLQAGDLVLYGHCGLGVPGHIAIVAQYDPATHLASTFDSARHGSVVGFRREQDTRSWGFTTAVRFRG